VTGFKRTGRCGGLRQLCCCFWNIAHNAPAIAPL
jgi:hypothetical protein